MTQNLPIIPPQTMPTVARYRTDRRLRHPRATPDLELIPEEDCRSIISEVEAALVPADRNTAINLVQFLLGCYPQRKPDDPEIYIRIMIDTFQNAPPDIGMEAADQITRRIKFIPARAEVVEVLEELVDRRKFQIDIARYHLLEHEKRRKSRTG